MGWLDELVQQQQQAAPAGAGSYQASSGPRVWLGRTKPFWEPGHADAPAPKESGPPAGVTRPSYDPPVPFSRDYWNSGSQRALWDGAPPVQPGSAGREDPYDGGDGSADIDSTVGMFYNFSGEEMDRLRKVAERLGVDTDWTSLKKLWESMVQDAAEAYTLGGKKVTPWQMAEMIADDYETEIGDQGVDEDPGYTGPVTSTSTQVSFTDPASAASLALSRFAEELGRRPSSKQSRAFQAALRAYEANNPRMTTTTIDPGPVDAEGNPLDPTQGPSQYSTSSGGADPAAFADSWLLSKFGDEAQVRWAAGDIGNVVDSLITSGRI